MNRYIRSLALDCYGQDGWVRGGRRREVLWVMALLLVLFVWLSGATGSIGADVVETLGSGQSVQPADPLATTIFMPLIAKPGIQAAMGTAGGEHTCVVITGGGVHCWGRNSDGQLGDGTQENRLTPVEVMGLSSGITALAAGGRHTCALATSGSVQCWGRNSSGQLGDGTQENRLTPVEVVGFEEQSQ